MLNPAKVHKIAYLASEKMHISESMLQRIEGKEQKIKILTMANQLEDVLSEAIMQAAKKGRMRFSLSSLAFFNIDGLSQKAVADSFSIIERVVNKSKLSVGKHYSVFDYPGIFKHMLLEDSVFDSSNTSQSIVPVFAFFDVMIRFKNAGFDVFADSSNTQKNDIYFAWQNINFKIDSGDSYNPIDFANIKIAELAAEIAALKDIDRLQANYESLLRENASIKKTLATLLSKSAGLIKNAQPKNNGLSEKGENYEDAGKREGYEGVPESFISELHQGGNKGES